MSKTALLYTSSCISQKEELEFLSHVKTILNYTMTNAKYILNNSLAIIEQFYITILYGINIRTY